MRAMYSVAAVSALAMAAQASALPADFNAKADAVLASSYAADAPGAAAIVVDDGKVVYASGRGLADVAGKRAITPDTVFRLGSITKQFTSAVILQLVEEGKVSLSDPLSKFLPDYPKPGSDATVAQLLNHTSGIQSYTGIPGFMSGPKPSQPFTTAALVAEFKDMPVEFDRGAKWNYNNSGYVLLGAIIEKVTGKAWHEAVTDRLAKPLGLKSIRYVVDERTIPAMALGYTMKEGKVQLARPIHPSVPHAAGALVGNVRDLAKWAQALHHGKVVKSESYKQMIAPTKLTDGKEVPYAFGLENEDVRGHGAIAHGGGIFGFSTNGIYLPSDELFIAVFANSDEPMTPASVASLRLAALAVGDPYPSFRKADVAPAAIEPLFGLYKWDAGERRFFAKDGKLYTRRDDGQDLEVFAAGDDRFFYGPNSLTWFAMKRDPKGAHVMEMYPGQAKTAELSTRAGPIPPEAEAVKLTKATLERYAGRYQFGPAPLLVALGDDGRLTVKLGEQPAIPIEPLSETLFRAIGPNAKIRFEVANNAVVRAVLIQNGRERPAERVN